MGDRVAFSVAVDALAQCVLVRVTGELDMASAGALEEALPPPGSTEHVVVDLSECTFVDSAGMRAIAAAARETPRVSVVANDPGVLRALEITAMDTMVSVHPTLADAV